MFDGFMKKPLQCKQIRKTQVKIREKVPKKSEILSYRCFVVKTMI